MHAKATLTLHFFLHGGANKTWTVASGKQQVQSKREIKRLRNRALFMTTLAAENPHHKRKKELEPIITGLKLLGQYLGYLVPNLVLFLLKKSIKARR